MDISSELFELLCFIVAFPICFILVVIGAFIFIWILNKIFDGDLF